MSQCFGELRQIAFVVRDIDAAMHYWSHTLGVGPFFIKRRIRFADYVYRGQAMDSPEVSIALANSGAMQIELIQQHDEQPSIYREFLQRGYEGLQHMAAWSTSSEMQQRREALLAQGYELAQECVIPSSGVKLAYFDTEAGPGGFIFELADLLEPSQLPRIENIRQAAQAWDGRNPVVEVTA